MRKKHRDREARQQDTPLFIATEDTLTKTSTDTHSRALRALGFFLNAPRWVRRFVLAAVCAAPPLEATGVRIAPATNMGE